MLPESDTNLAKTESEIITDCFKIIGKEKDSFIESYVATGQNGTRFFIIAEVLNKEIEADTIADSIVETFRKHFFEETTLDPYSQFEESLKFVNDVAREMQSNGIPIYQLNIAIAALSADVLYLSQSNDAEIYLARKGALSNISEGLNVTKRKDHFDLFENIASGNLEKGDSVLFSTARLIRYVTQTNLARLFLNKNIDKGLDDLATTISTDVLGRIGVLGLKINAPLVEVDLQDEVELGVNAAKLEIYKVKAKKFLKESMVTIKELKDIVKKFLSGKKIKTDKLKHKNIVYAGAYVILGLFILGLLSVTGILESQTTKANKALVAEATTIISSAKTEQDRGKAAEMVLAATAKLKEASETRKLSSTIEDLNTELNTIKTRVDNLVVIDELEVFADISEKRSDANILGLIKVLNNYYAYDSSRMYEFIGSLVKDPINLVDQGNIVAGTGFEDSESLVFFTDSNRIREYAGGIIKFMETDEGQYKPMSEVLTYGSRLYAFDPNEGQIWKYQRKRDSYASAEPSLANVDFENVKKSVSFAIDGSIYLLYKNGEIEKYYAGSKSEEFAILNKPITQIIDASYIYTEYDSPYVLVLEPGAKKVLQYIKDPKTEGLQYQRQYLFENLNELTGFIVDFANRRLLVSDKDTVYVTEFLN